MEKSNGRLDTAEEKNYWKAGLELVTENAAQRQRSGN